MANQPTLLVTGASGHLGRRAAEILLETKAGKVIAGTRDPSKIADLAAKGAEIRKVDFDDPALADAFKGVDRLLLISTDALDTPGKRLKQHKAAIEDAKKAGVKHIVYTSMPKPEPGSPIPFAPDHYGTEQALAESGIGWTVLRNSWYQENLFHSLPQVLASGKWFSAAGDGKVAHVSREDAAYAAAAALAAATERQYALRHHRLGTSHHKGNREARCGSDRQADRGRERYRRAAYAGHDRGRPARFPRAGIRELRHQHAQGQHRDCVRRRAGAYGPRAAFIEAILCREKRSAPARPLGGTYALKGGRRGRP